jgi:hypothetical protein
MTAVNNLLGSQPEELRKAFDDLIGSEDSKKLYGKDQERYQKWREDCVERVAAGKFGCSLESILAHLGRERGKIAEELDSYKAEQFGLSRRDPDLGDKSVLTHLISERYGKLNQNLRKVFQERFPFFQENMGTTKIEETPYTRVTFERHDSSRIMREINEYYAGKFKGTKEQSETCVELWNGISGIYDQIQALYPDLKLELLDPEEVPRIIGISPLQFLTAKIEAKVNGVWKPLTTYLTWLSQPGSGPIQETAIEYFKRRGFVTLIHTPRDAIDSHIHAVDSYVRKLLTATCANPNEKVRNISFLQHRLFHLVPYNRGSTSVVEIIMEAIHKKQGLPKLQISDTDAFSQLFVERYMSEFARSTKMP